MVQQYQQSMKFNSLSRATQHDWNSTQLSRQLISNQFKVQQAEAD